MATYRELHGRSIQAVTTDPTGSVAEGQIWYNTTSDTFKSVVLSEAWSSATSMVNNHDSGMGSGEKDSALVGAGASGSSGTSAVEQFNGSGWATSPSLPGNAQAGAGTGPETAALWTQGTSFPIPGPGAVPASTATYEYNGSSWTSGGAQGTGKIMGGMSGTETAALAFGGRTTLPGGGPVTNTSEEYNGSSFSEGNNLNNGRSKIGFSGTQTAALGFGGDISNTASGTAATEEYDGTSWTTSGNLNTARRYIQGFGIQTSSLAFGGQNNATLTEQYDGSTWTVKSTMGSGFATTQSSVSPSASTGIAAGGYTAPFGATTNTAEEWNASINVITPSTWSSGGALNTGRSLAAGAITSGTSGIVFGGSSPYTGKTESYDGTSWTELGDMNSARSYLSGFGTATAAVAAGGYFSTPGTPNVPKSEVEEWNGSAWSEETNLPASRKSAGNCGTLTAGLIMGGSSQQPYTSHITTTTFEYDGSSWTAGGALPEGKGQAASGGTQTASFYAAGVLAPGGRSSKTAFYNGSSWSEGANVVTISPSSGGLGATGTTSAGLGTSGNNLTNIYDGTSWVTAPNYSTARNRGTGGGTASDALLVAGYSAPASPAYRAETEEFSGETTAVNVKTLTQS